MLVGFNENDFQLYKGIVFRLIMTDALRISSATVDEALMATINGMKFGILAFNSSAK